MEWSIAPGMEQEVLDFYISTVGPLLSSAPEMLRFRFFEIDNATVWQTDSYITKEKKDLHKYFTLCELESEQWPWEELLELSKLDKWRNWFEAQTVVVRLSMLTWIYNQADVE